MAWIAKGRCAGSLGDSAKKGGPKAALTLCTAIGCFRRIAASAAPSQGESRWFRRRYPCPFRPDVRSPLARRQLSSAEFMIASSAASAARPAFSSASLELEQAPRRFYGPLKRPTTGSSVSAAPVNQNQFRSQQSGRSWNPSRHESLGAARQRGTRKHHRARVPRGTGFP
jgi:hypothetical protein